MCFATAGFFPKSSPVFDILRIWVLPASLFLLFLSTNIPDILKLGPKTIAVVVIGSIGVVVGATVGVAAIAPFFHMGLLPEHHVDSLWKGVAALSGSWMGGSANMAAVWESVAVGGELTNVEGEIFSAMVAIDVIVAYGWMAIVIALAAYQARVDRWTKADATQVENVNKHMEELQKSEARFITTPTFLYMITLAFLATLICLSLAAKINSGLEQIITNKLILSIVSAYAITIILITIFGLVSSLTPLRKLEGYGASKVGYALLYLVLARIGAKANLNAIGDYPWYILMGVVWVCVHATFLIAAMRFMRVPMFFAATASQANLGGPVSAPVVAAAYQPNLAVVGLLMAVIGNVVGTFFALFLVAPLIQIITPLLM
jgi:uncharacterized membrane protein